MPQPGIRRRSRQGELIDPDHLDIRMMSHIPKARQRIQPSDLTVIRTP